MGTKVLLAFALLLGSCAAASTGLADEVIDRFRLTFDNMDFNRNGALEPDEGPAAYGWKSGLFKLKDLDDDGRITFPEYVGWTASPRTRWLVDALSAEVFEALDGDEDGRLARADEWLGGSGAFEARDADRDGYLTRREAGLPPV